MLRFIFSHPQKVGLRDICNKFVFHQSHRNLNGFGMNGNEHGKLMTNFSSDMVVKPTKAGDRFSKGYCTCKRLTCKENGLRQRSKEKKTRHTCIKFWSVELWSSRLTCMKTDFSCGKGQCQWPWNIYFLNCKELVPLTWKLLFVNAEVQGLLARKSTCLKNWFL